MITVFKCLAARRARGDGKRGYRKSGKHAGRKRGEDLYDPTVCFEVAKKFLDTNILPENSHFTIRQLIEKEVGNTSGIAMVLRVLRGFKFVQKVCKISLSTYNKKILTK